jgi:hypothetical protein
MRLLKAHTPSKCNDCNARCEVKAQCTTRGKKKSSIHKAVNSCFGFTKRFCENCSNGTVLSKYADRPLHEVYVRCRLRKCNVSCKSVCSRHV